MPDKAELGRRVKSVRLAKSMTLKGVADGSGMSPTHISEIERGRTSPTVGALAKIARALGTPPTYFVEEDELPTISVVRKHERRTMEVPDGERGSAASYELLTRGVPAGRIKVSRIIRLSGPIKGTPTTGEIALLVMHSKITVTVDGEKYELDTGDCIHFKASLPHSIERLGEENPLVLRVDAQEGLLLP